MQLTRLQRLAAQAIVSVFETGRPVGGYGQVTVLRGDAGGLTYGRFQTTLASGALYFLIKDYVERPGAAHVAGLSKYLARLLKRDLRLNSDLGLRRLLKRAGDDPVMRQTQDDFFDRNFWTPAVEAARELGVTTALGVAVIYDGKVHGSFERMRDRTTRAVGSPAAIGEEAWITAYVANRRDWLGRHARPILRGTVYRMAAFQRLIRADNWDLDLPFTVAGVRIDEASLGAEGARRRAARILALADPPMTGDDVRQVQARLRELGYPAETTGAYDEATEAQVRKFQAAQGLKVDGYVGPATRARLNAPAPVERREKAAAIAAPPAPLPADGAAVARVVQAAAGAAGKSGKARAVRRGASNVLTSAVGNLLGPWLTRYSLAPVAAVGALSAGFSQFRDLLPSPDDLTRSSDWVGTTLRPPYEWFVKAVPEEAAGVLALGALLWVLAAVALRRRHARGA